MDAKTYDLQRAAYARLTVLQGQHAAAERANARAARETVIYDPTLRMEINRRKRRQALEAARDHAA